MVFGSSFPSSIFVLYTDRLASCIIDDTSFLAILKFLSTIGSLRFAAKLIK